jgi:hypothetical protein
MAHGLLCSTSKWHSPKGGTMIREGDKFKDCSTGTIYRVEKAQEDLMVLTTSNGLEPITLYVDPRDPLQIPPLQEISERSQNLHSS